MSRNRAGIFARLAAASVFVAAALSSAAADPVADFYNGKRLTILSGFTPNGEFDTYGRIFGRHFGRHIPGQPQILNTNMPGAGTLIAANHLYARAAPDGLTIGNFTAHAAIEPFFENKSAVFDPRKFAWIGSLSQDLQFCAIRPAEGVPTTVKELLQTEAVFGASMPSSDIYKHTAVIKNTLGLKIRMVTGYSGMPAVNLALARGEVRGVCGYTPLALKTRYADDLAKGALKLVLQMGPVTTQDFGNVPSVFDHVRSEEGRAILEFFFKSLAIGRPFAAPPGTPDDRVMALRAAFTATLRDPAFLAEAKQLNLSIDPVSVETIEEQVARVGSLPRDFFERVRKAAE